MENAPQNNQEPIEIDLESDDYFEKVRPIKEKKDFLGPLALSGREYKMIGSSPNINISEDEMDTPLFKLMTVEDIRDFIKNLESNIVISKGLPMEVIYKTELDGTRRLLDQEGTII